MSFTNFVQQQSMATGELPLVHTTEYFRLDSIQTTNELHTSPCHIFNESLLYFFYGRPAYRDPKQLKPATDFGFYPICFIFRSQSLCKKAKRMYPFDSGASQSGLYEPAIKASMALNHYQLPAAIDNARRIVGCFFESDEDYMSNSPRTGLAISPSETDAQSYYNLIQGSRHPDCDDRCSAIEIQIADDINIIDGVLAVALPNCFLDDAVLRNTLLKVWRAKLLPYDADKGMRPIECHGAIRTVIRQYYRRSRII